MGWTEAELAEMEQAVTRRMLSVCDANNIPMVVDSIILQPLLLSVTQEVAIEYTLTKILRGEYDEQTKG